MVASAPEAESTRALRVGCVLAHLMTATLLEDAAVRHAKVN